ncbi:hypothetical protein DM826_07280 [Halonotius aquaticus]|jgi:hypothetical protein|uniref:Uncharacterized protein n=1 Tax=Halonotius aquaticus TaxID=2216978 RepID=A0A3A6PRC9_9EURY|nr:hypothetical protein [Halonotius aquaticus]RJX43100.1 hypothetical protein DM826_07280 [Halonotius aquaticus]
MQFRAVDGHLPVGSRVVDRHAELPESPDSIEECRPMRVVDDDLGPASEVIVDETPVAEIPPNDQHPADDRVIAVVFEADLNARTPDWTDNLDTLDEYLAWFKREWSVAIQKYRYPVSRLQIPIETAATN